MMPRERRLELIELARRHDCIVVEDNCYADVHFEGEKPPAVYALDDDPRQVYLCSLSKIFAPGVRLGYLTATPAMLERILAKRHDAGQNTLAAAITHEYLQDRLSRHINVVNAALKVKRDAILAALEAHLGNLCSFSHPIGDLFIWVRLPDENGIAHL
jgi:2-aminoadipate transaminase